MFYGASLPFCILNAPSKHQRELFAIPIVGRKTDQLNFLH